MDTLSLGVLSIGAGMFSIIFGSNHKDNEADILEDDAHSLQCKDRRCREHAATLTRNRIALVKRYKCAAPALRLRAIVEDWSLPRIKCELGKE